MTRLKTAVRETNRDWAPLIIEWKRVRLAGAKPPAIFTMRKKINRFMSMGLRLARLLFSTWTIRR